MCCPMCAHMLPTWWRVRILCCWLTHQPHRWGNGLGGAATFLGKYTVTASKTDITEIWRTNARTEDGMLNTLCKCDPIAERVWLATR